MTRTVTIRAVLIALACAAWGVPLARAFRLLNYALSVDDGTINTTNDTGFGSSLRFLLFWFRGGYCDCMAATEHAGLATVLASRRIGAGRR